MKYISNFFSVTIPIAMLTMIIASIHLLFSISDDEKKWDRQREWDEADYREMQKEKAEEKEAENRYWEDLHKEDVEIIHAQIDYKIQKIKDLLDLGPQTPAMLEIKENCFIAIHEKGIFKDSIRDK